MDKSTSDELNISEHWFQSLFERAPDPAWIIEDNQFVECNNAAIKALGYSCREELLNIHPSKLSPPIQPDGEDSFTKAERMMGIAKNSGLHRFEWTHKRADGTDFLAEVTLSNIELADKKVIYCVWRDITDHKVAEERLRHSETQQVDLTNELRLRTKELENTVNALSNTRNELETILRNAWIGVVQVSQDRTILRANRHFEEVMFGYDESEMQGHYSEILYPSKEDYENIGRNAYPSLAAGKPYSLLECVCRRKNGTTFLAQIVGSLTDPTDFKKGSIWLFSDVTERKAAEEHLSQTLAELETIFQNPSVGIFYTVDRYIIRVNKTFETMANRSSSQLIGKTTRFIYESDEAYEAAGQKIHSAFSAGANCRYDIVVSGTDGLSRVYELFGSMVDIRDPQKGSIWHFSDVSEIRSAQEKLRSNFAELEATHAKLKEMGNQLLQSEKLASIGQLAAGVAHEINNPIGFVNSNLGTLKRYITEMLSILSAYEKSEEEMTAETREALTELKRKIDIVYLREDIYSLLSESMDGMQRVKRIVQDLKDFSHVDTAELQSANLEQGMDSTLNVVWNELKYKAEIIKDYGGIPNIVCIPAQLNQVFMNLLMNAGQAIEEHGRITIRTGQDEGNVWVEVEDTGKGINPEHLERIFDPFFTTKPVGTGTGLGLSLSYGIVKKHGGRIEVKSELGKGTVMRVLLPIKPDIVSQNDE
jgi:two-component system NtrC family sensor kinase